MDEKNSEKLECSCNAVNQEIINEVKNKLTEEDKLYDLAELFKVFGDSTRIKILSSLAESTMCVCDIACLLNMTQSAISHQLRILKTAKLVKYQRKGKAIYYSLDDNHVEAIFRQGLEHINE